MTVTGPRSAAPPEELVARFRAALERLWPEAGKLGLAVSGGPDSMAMLLLAHAAIPGQFEVATVDHGLRAEAKDECALVMSTCEARGIPCTLLAVEVADGNLQDRARIARYDALAGWARRSDLSAIATAHHADDQAETFVMRLNRASGVAGLAGVRERGTTPRCDATVIRPLLAFRRADLLSAIEAAGIAVVYDPSNDDDRFDRVRIRKELAKTNWLDVGAIAATARHLADAEEAIEHYLQQLLAEHAWAERDAAGFRPPPSREMRLRLARWAIEDLGSCARGQDVARLVERLAAGKGGNVGGLLVSIEGDDWVFRREPPRRTG